MKKFLALAVAALLLSAGSFIEPLRAQSVTVAATCSAQSLPVGYNNGTLIQTQNGDLCTNATGGGGGGNTTVTATAVAPTYIEGSSTNPISSGLKGGIRFMPITPAGVNVDLSLPSSIMGLDGSTIMSDSNPLAVRLKAGTPSQLIGTVGIDQTTPGTTNNVAVGSSVLPTGAATEASLAKLTISQTSGSAGASGPMVQCAVSAAAPSYSGTQVNPVSCDTSGNVRSAVVGTGPVSNGTAQSGSELTGCVFNTTKPTLTTGQQAAVQCTTRGELSVVPLSSTGNAFGTSAANADGVAAATGMSTWSEGALYNGATWDRMRGIAGSFGAATGVVAVEQAGASFQYIPTATTTQVKSGAGILHKIIINTPVAAATISLIDNTSGSTVNIGLITMTTDLKPFSITYDLAFTTGLRIITSGATDITVVYR